MLNKKLRNRLEQVLVELNKLQNNFWTITNSQKLPKGQKVLQSEKIKLKIRRLTKEKELLVVEYIDQRAEKERQL